MDHCTPVNQANLTEVSLRFPDSFSPSIQSLPKFGPFCFFHYFKSAPPSLPPLSYAAGEITGTVSRASYLAEPCHWFHHTHLPLKSPSGCCQGNSPKNENHIFLKVPWCFPFVNRSKSIFIIQMAWPCYLSRLLSRGPGVVDETHHCGH